MDYQTRSNDRPVEVKRHEDGTATITGYGAVFFREGEPGTEFELARGIVERIGRTAFDRAIAEKHDARSMFNHDPNHLLGRVSAGTLRLSVDKIGLRYETDVPKSQMGIVESIERGDVDGSSFWFRITKETKTEDDGVTRYTIDDVDLREVGPVVFPAYEATTASLRAKRIEQVTRERDEEQKQKDMDEAEAMLAILELDESD